MNERSVLWTTHLTTHPYGYSTRSTVIYSLTVDSEDICAPACFSDHVDSSALQCTHPKNSLATEFPAVCHGVQSAPNKKSPLNKTGKKGFSCINNNNNNNDNNDKKKKWKRIQMDSLRLEEQFRNCNCGVDDVTHEKLNK